ncbi:MAG: ScyD/ScyE family protein [Balneolaceae bacterium]
MAIAILFYFSACNDNVSPGLEDSLELFAGLEEIPEAASSNVTINRGTNESADGWFRVEIENIEDNPFVKTGETEAWCLEWKKTLRSDNDTHQGVKWFATHNNDKWKPMNYFFSIRGDLAKEYPNLNNREIQAVIWILAGHMEIAPEFDVLNLTEDEFPSRLRSNGTVNINRERVAEISGLVMNGYKDADIQWSAMVGQTADDEQDIIIPPNREYSFDGPIFDILALPNGNLLVPDFATVKEIKHKNNSVSDLITLPLVEGPGAFGDEEITFINGLSSFGGGSFFASRSGLDLALGAALFRVSSGNSQLIGDIESFTLGDWPDGEPGQAPDWIDFRCEVPGGYSAGPQTNPYHITALSGSEVLVADAAGNTLLLVKNNGTVEVIATFDPIADPDTGDRLVQFQLGDGTECPVEPVPTDVVVGDDGAYYVSELTGTTAENLAGSASTEGLASIWRIEPGASEITCPSANCTKAVTGLNSVIDMEFGPDGYLYVVEFDTNGFFAAVVLSDLGFGTVKKCDVSTGNCEVLEDNLVLPGAITFDKWDNLWLVDNVFAPTIRQVSTNQSL